MGRFTPAPLVSGSAGSAPGDTDAVFAAEVPYVLAASATQVLPIGGGFFEANAHVSLQYSTDGGATWRTVYAVTQGGWYESDGANVRLLADATGGTAHILPLQ